MSEIESRQQDGYAEIGGGDPNTPATVLVGIVGAILVFVAIVALQALFYSAENDQFSRINRGNPRQLSRLRAEQLETINSYGWKDQREGTVTIPIDRAMELIVAEQGSDSASAPPRQRGERL